MLNRCVIWINPKKCAFISVYAYNYLKACRQVCLCDLRRVGICIFYFLFAQRVVNYYYRAGSGRVVNYVRVVIVCTYLCIWPSTPLPVGGKSNGRQMSLNKLINKGSAGVRQKNNNWKKKSVIFASAYKITLCKGVETW